MRKKSFVCYHGIVPCYSCVLHLSCFCYWKCCCRGNFLQEKQRRSDGCMDFVGKYSIIPPLCAPGVTNSLKGDHWRPCSASCIWPRSPISELPLDILHSGHCKHALAIRLLNLLNCCPCHRSTAYNSSSTHSSVPKPATSAAISHQQHPPQARRPSSLSAASIQRPSESPTFFIPSQWPQDHASSSRPASTQWSSSSAASSHP